MSGRATRLALLLPPLLAACQPAPPQPPPHPPERPAGEDWRALVRAEDRDRLARLGAAWEEGLARARAAGFGSRLRAEGALLEPGAALPRAAPPPGSYRCRVVRLGAGPGRRAHAAYPEYFCHIGVEAALLAFTKQTGAERPGGYLFDDGDARLVFLGAMAGPEQALPPAYGEDAGRDAVGVAERVGPFRYRLVMPWPRGGAALDVLELVPVVPDVR